MWNVLIVQWCPTLCNPMDWSLPGSPVHGILQARNTGVGSHSLLQWIFLTQGLNPGLLHCRQIPYFLSLSWPLLIPKYHIESEVAQSCPTLCDPMDCSLRLLHLWDSPGKNTGVGCHFLLQEIFPTQGLNLGLRIAGRRFIIWATREVHILIPAFMTIQLAITLYEGLKTTPIWFFSINLISVPGRHSLLRKRCYHTQDLILCARPHNGMLIGNQLASLWRLGSFWVLTVQSSWKYLEPCVCFGTLANVWIGGKQARDE